MIPLSDEQLIRQAREGAEDAFQELVRRYEPRIAATVIGMLGQCSEAEDVGQETVIRFYRSLESFRGESSVSTYLTRIAINLSLNELKRRKRRWRFFSRDDSGITADIPDEKSGKISFEDREMVNLALEKLSPEFRAVLVLRLIDGYSTRETAQILGIPTGTVLSRLTRAQLKMREILKPHFGEK